MANVPFVRGKIVWWYTIPQILLIFLLIWGFSQFAEEGMDVLYAFIAYWAILYLLRWLIATDHRKGIAALKKNHYEQALAYFKKSVSYFERNAWIDKYRFITLFSSSRMGYREMGLCNEAFTLSQMGRGAEAKELYKKILSEYPDNGIAIAALKMMEAI
ncbi:hypothetical protein CKK33_08800 [Mucilaginibacter sp. MD40]|uniref:tetratricopeptide repeat protein n=1 Tax=Mucilaginibacter sp. MD40 TaxID=2029590 RepID=UPI000BAC5600|nr:hypothetical protein [Mucilaginibacter sp. MD40]PAW93587.1 hypothetical protein CKK33_08800 [Mucilaginibacter sp. MD40]